MRCKDNNHSLPSITGCHISIGSIPKSKCRIMREPNLECHRTQPIQSKLKHFAGMLQHLPRPCPSKGQVILQILISFDIFETFTGSRAPKGLVIQCFQPWFPKVSTGVFDKGHRRQAIQWLVLPAAVRNWWTWCWSRLQANIDRLCLYGGWRTEWFCIQLIEVRKHLNSIYIYICQTCVIYIYKTNQHVHCIECILVADLL